MWEWLHVKEGERDVLEAEGCVREGMHRVNEGSGIWMGDTWNAQISSMRLIGKRG